MKNVYTPYNILLATEMVLALICGRYSCEWGNRVYFYSGILILCIAFILPLLQKTWPVGKRIGFGFLFLIGSVIIWFAGFILGEFRIMCRLF